MRRFLGILVMLVVLMSCSVAVAEKVTLSNDVVVNTTPFGASHPLNRQYQLFAGMVIDVDGQYDGWTIIHYNDEFGTLYIETGTHGTKQPTSIQNDGQTVVRKGIIGNGYSVWVRYEPKSVFEKGESKGDVILHGGDVVEIVGDIVYDEQGNGYYPIRFVKEDKQNGKYYVLRYVTAKYVNLPIE